MLGAAMLFEKKIMTLRFNDLHPLLNGAGQKLYGGEAISQLEHALQAAHFAQLAGGDAAAITAALLHDIGHIICEQQEHDVALGIDDQHEFVAVTVLKDLFDQRVLFAIARHVDAKRYLCATEADYLTALSPASQMSLQLQGGVMNHEQAMRFAASSYAKDAIFLRRCDDQAKVVGLVTAPLNYFLQIAKTICISKELA